MFVIVYNFFYVNLHLNKLKTLIKKIIKFKKKQLKNTKKNNLKLYKKNGRSNKNRI